MLLGGLSVNLNNLKNQLDPEYIYNLKFNLSGDATMTVRIPGFHAMGARKEVTNGKDYACIEACDTNPVCMAADYNQNEESCWVHMKGGEGVCGLLVDSPPVIHYKKYQCGKQLLHYQCSQCCMNFVFKKTSNNNWITVDLQSF